MEYWSIKTFPTANMFNKKHRLVHTVFVIKKVPIMSHCIFSKKALFGIKGMQTAIKIGFGKPYNPRFPMEFEAFFKKMGWPITQQ